MWKKSLLFSFLLWILLCCSREKQLDTNLKCYYYCINTALSWHKKGDQIKAQEFVVKSTCFGRFQTYNVCDLTELLIVSGKHEEAKELILRGLKKQYNRNALYSNDTIHNFIKNTLKLNDSKIIKIQKEAKAELDTDLLNKIQEILDLDQKGRTSELGFDTDSLNFIKLSELLPDKLPTYESIGFDGMANMFVLILHQCRNEKYSEFWSVEKLLSWFETDNGISSQHLAMLLDNHFDNQESGLQYGLLDAWFDHGHVVNYDKIDSMRYQIGLVPIIETKSYAEGFIEKEKYIHEPNNCACH